MSIIKTLTTSFDRLAYALFLERLVKNNNTKAINFINSCDICSVGIECKRCKKIKPIYDFSANKNSKFGISSHVCKICHRNSLCPYSVMLNSMKRRSIKRGDPPPEHTVETLKNLYQRQYGKCLVNGKIMNEAQGDGNPYNMSPERKSNSKHYTLDNVVLICQKFQIGGVYDFSCEEISSWYKYDSTNDGFVFDPSIFNKKKKKRRSFKINKIENGKRICSHCIKKLPVSKYYKRQGTCKPCVIHFEKLRRNEPHGFIIKLVRDARKDSRKRGAVRSRFDTSHECDENLYELFLDIIKAQGGRCADTGIPLVYKTGHKFAASPDRIDDSKGYIKGNVRFIIAPLNTNNSKEF